MLALTVLSPDGMGRDSTVIGRTSRDCGQGHQRHTAMSNSPQQRHGLNDVYVQTMERNTNATAQSLQEQRLPESGACGSKLLPFPLPIWPWTVAQPVVVEKQPFDCQQP